MQAEFEATLSQVHALFDARLATAERAAERPDATDAERHIVGAMKKLHQAQSQPSSLSSSPDRPEGPSSGDDDSYGRAVPSLSGSPGQARR